MLAALFIGAGLVSLLAILDVGDIDPVDILAGALLLVGGAMVIGAWRGNARPLIALGLPLVGLLLVAGAVDMPLDAGAGDRTRIVDSVAELDERYELTAGELTLDLRDLPLGPRTRSSELTLDAEVAFGELVVIVPRDANVEVDAHVAVGEINGSPDGVEDGVDLRNRFDLDGDEGTGLLVLDLEVGFGSDRGATCVGIPSTPSPWCSGWCSPPRRSWCSPADRWPTTATSCCPPACSAWASPCSSRTPPATARHPPGRARPHSHALRPRRSPPPRGVGRPRRHRWHRRRPLLQRHRVDPPGRGRCRAPRRDLAPGGRSARPTGHLIRVSAPATCTSTGADARPTP